MGMVFGLAEAVCGAATVAAAADKNVLRLNMAGPLPQQFAVDR
jgi:hypothetical protein